MSTALPIIRYALDVTGINPDNAVHEEPHTLVMTRDVRAIAPQYGSFFSESVVVTEASTSTVLVKDVDYSIVELNQAVSVLYGKEICTLILIINPLIGPIVLVSYQALGGQNERNSQTVANVLNELQVDNRPVTWPNIVGKPDQFLPSMHLHDIGDTYGWEDIVAAMERIRQAILLADSPALESVLSYIDARISVLENGMGTQLIPFNTHLTNTNNPHATTKNQVGLGNVSNFATATSPQAAAGIATNLHVTPAGVKAYVDANIQVIPDAADLVKGKIALNIGNVFTSNVSPDPRDDNNAIDALTTTGLIRMLAGTNAFASLNHTAANTEVGLLQGAVGDSVLAILKKKKGVVGERSEALVTALVNNTLSPTTNALTATSNGLSVELHSDPDQQLSIIGGKLFLGGVTKTITGSANFQKLNNRISLIGIVAALGLEPGDVISVLGSIGNNKYFTVESLTANTVEVNIAHKNGAGPLSLFDETGVIVTIKLLSKWYNAPLGLGQKWVNVLADRNTGTPYTNTFPNRSIQVSWATAGDGNAGYVDGIGIVAVPDAYAWACLQMIVTPGSSYQVDGAGKPNLGLWSEMR